MLYSARRRRITKISIDVKEANAKREQLHGIILSISDAAKRFCEISGQDNPEMIDKLSGFAGRTETDSFKILIIGEFKNGKSTFINALLGERVLLQDVLPCTAVISEVVYGEEKGAVIHFENPLPEVISKHLHEKINSQIAEHKDDPEGVPPLEMTFEELKHVITIPEKELLGDDNANDPEDFSPNPEDETEAGKEAIGKIPLSHAEIRFPLEILKDGVEIIDTPGLNEDKSREEVTRNYLKNADAIVFLFRYPKYLSMNDYASIRMLKQVHDGIFFVINAVDMAENPVQLARLKKSALAKLVNLTSLKAGGVFFTSALKTLEMLESQPAKKSEPEITEPSEPEAEPELPAEPERKRVNLVKNLSELAVKSPAEQGINGMKDVEATLSKYLKENRAAAELAKFSEARKKYYEEAERLKAEQKKYAEEFRMKNAPDSKQKPVSCAKKEAGLTLKCRDSMTRQAGLMNNAPASKKKFHQWWRKTENVMRKTG